MTDYPHWVTPENLGTFIEGTSFTSTPRQLSFGVSDPTQVQVQLLNGVLPPGLLWSVQGEAVVLTGVLLDVTVSRQFEFTFRLISGHQIADRTFVIHVQNTVFNSFTWRTPTNTPIARVFTPVESVTQVQAVTDPLSAITYTWLNESSLSQGIQLNEFTGTIQINYAWQPLRAYVQQRDFVFSESGLYECEISGTSGSVQAPEGMGQFVDTDYAAWQPQRFYSINSVVHADQGKIYLCIQAGFSAFVGPTGVGLAISDGSVLWAYQDQSCVWRRVTPQTIVPQQLHIQAQSQGQTIQNTYLIQLLSTPYEPIWLTEPADLPPAITQQSYSFALQAVDPDLQPLTWSSMDLPDWLQLNIIGELSGIAPLVDQNTTFTFTISVFDGVSTSSRTFDLLVQEFEVEFAWITPEDLGSHPDGVFSRIQLEAVSTRSQTFVTYGLSGGQLPVGVRLNPQSGALEGVLEFHARPKTYVWEVTTSDGVEELVRRFQITVIPQQLGHHWRLSAPLWGPDRDDWFMQNNEGVVSSDSLYLPDQTGYGRDIPPELNICTGIQALNAEHLRLLLQHYLHDFVIHLHDYQVTPTHISGVNLLSVRVQDAQTVKLWQPFTQYGSGTRVSNTQRVRYLALSSGTSGAQEPVGMSDQISDGLIMWRPDGVVNDTSAHKSALPWYPYHDYQLSQTVQHLGHTYQVIQPGRSGGSWRPISSPFLDNQVEWQRMSSPVISGNTFWPACVFNLRKTLIDQVGWSTGEGSGVTSDVTVNSRGQITRVLITHPGSGYYRSPQIQVLGSGSGAHITCELSVIQVQVVNGGTGWQLNEQVHIKLGDHTQVIVKITAVSQTGSVTSCDVVHSDAFERMRRKPIRVPDALGRVLTIQFICGVTSCDVVNAGTGYDARTRLFFSGREYVPVWDKFVDPDQSGAFVPVSYVTESWSQKQDLSVLNAPFQDQLWQISLIKATLQGVEYEGSTSWDDHACTWDSDQTRLVEISPATVLTWDQDQTVWDNDSTTWDHPQIIWPSHSQTVFDDNRTIWDYYRTIFDQSEPSKQSVYAKSWAWWFGDQPPFRTSK